MRAVLSSPAATAALAASSQAPWSARATPLSSASPQQVEKRCGTMRSDEE